jgi:hypothetical protein
MSLSFLKDDCYQTAHLNRFCIEFHLDAHRRRGFHASQLLEYSLDPNPGAAEDKDAPPQRLSLAFSTADVVILGWRLDRLADRLAENQLAAVGVLSKRYAELDRQKPFVASIEIKPVGKG